MFKFGAFRVWTILCRCDRGPFSGGIGGGGSFALLVICDSLVDPRSLDSQSGINLRCVRGSLRGPKEGSPKSSSMKMP